MTEETQTPEAGKKTCEFKAEVRKVLQILTNSLYTNREIFLRELVSNASDALDKLRFRQSKGETPSASDLPLEIRITLDKDKKTLTIADTGIGMTEQDLADNLGIIARSGSENFLAQLAAQSKTTDDKGQARPADASQIIGRFGVGFYSVFMVAKKVDVISRPAFGGDGKAHMWESDGLGSYTLSESSDEEPKRGTKIVVYLKDDAEEFAEKYRVEAIIRKHSAFVPFPVYVDGEHVNTQTALWREPKSQVKPEQYKEFYRELYPMSDEPLFSIHLNIDYPFHLTGILYFPKIHNNFEIQKNKIQLYSNQVYVTDQVEGIVPEYLTLLHGVIDSPDIPLNVSRSYLQSDANVKKISSYITRKVADRLQELFSTMRSDYEAKWDDLKIFIQYGILTDEKFAEKAAGIMLWKNVEGKYFTPKEYAEKVKENQTDKNKTEVFLYVDDPVEKHTFLEAAKGKGYDVLVMDGQLDSHYINWYESKNKESRFVRVDSDVVDKLIQKEENVKMSLTEGQQEVLTPVFESQMPKDDKIHYNISFEAMSPDEAPVVITQNEFMRRMKEMAQTGGGGMSQFYGQMPDNFTIAVNANHPIVIDILADVEKSYGDKLKSITKKIDAAVAEEKRFDEVVKGKKEEELSSEEKSTREELSKKIVTLRDERNQRLREIGGENRLVKQIIDLALLTNGMLKGKNLTDFIQRSISLIGK